MCKANPNDALLKDECKSVRNKVAAKIRLTKKNHHKNIFAKVEDSQYLERKMSRLAETESAKLMKLEVETSEI